MAYLIDTHIYICWVAEPSKLSPNLVELLSRRSSQVFVSAMVPREMCINQTIGKIEFDEKVLDIEDCTGFSTLDITPVHAKATRQLPMIHRDPFDRILLAQAMSEGLTFVTNDRQCLQYAHPELEVLDATKA